VNADTASSLARALGRPIRDQVFSTRNTVATTLQALELVNGERLSNWLLRGARNMLGELPPPPTALFVTPINARGGRADQPHRESLLFRSMWMSQVRLALLIVQMPIDGCRQVRSGVGTRRARRRQRQ